MPAIRQQRGKDARKKDPDAPKKPLNAFMLYKLDPVNQDRFKQDRQEYLNEHSGEGKSVNKGSLGHASKCLSDRWRSESMEVKQRYRDMAKEKKRIYDAENEAILARRTLVPHIMEEEEAQEADSGGTYEDHSHSVTYTRDATPSGSSQKSPQTVQMPQAFGNIVTASLTSVSNISYLTRNFDASRGYPPISIRPSLHVDTRVSPYDYCSSSQGDGANATWQQTPRLGPQSGEAVENSTQFQVRQDHQREFIDEPHRQPFVGAHQPNQFDEQNDQVNSQAVDVPAYSGPVVEGFTSGSQALNHCARTPQLDDFAELDNFLGFQAPGTQPMNYFDGTGDSSSTAAGWAYGPSLDLTESTGYDSPGVDWPGLSDQQFFEYLVSQDFFERSDWPYSPLNESAAGSPQDELDTNNFRGGAGSNGQYWTYL